MLKRSPEHTIRMWMSDQYGHLLVEPPLSLKEYDVAAGALRLERSERLYEQSLTGDESATEFKIQVDSERHLNGRANCLLNGLQAVGVKVELDDTIAYVQ